MRKLLYTLAFVLFAATASAETRREFAGGWYCEAQPNGSFAVSIQGSHIETESGTVQFPKAGVEPLFLRLSPSGNQFAVAGSDDIGYVRRGGMWLSIGPVFATNPIVYRPDGTIEVVSGPGETGSQGYRYADALGLVKGDDTYNDQTMFAQQLGVRQLYEWTYRDGIAVGQGGDEEGLQVTFNGKRVLLEPGINRRITFNKEGNKLAICSAKFAERKAVAIWLTTEELAAKPAYEIPGTTPPPPPPPPPPQEKPLPDYTKAKDIVAFERSKFGKMNEEQVSVFLKNVARAFNAAALKGGPFGVLRKDGGTQCNGYACDIICTGNGDKQRQWDMMSDAEPGGKQEAGWPLESKPLETIVVRPCEIPDGVIPPPTDDEPDPELEKLREHIKVLEKIIVEHTAALEEQEAKIKERDLRILELEKTVELQLKEIERLRAVPEKECEVTGVPRWLKNLFGIGCAVKSVPPKQEAMVSDSELERLVEPKRFRSVYSIYYAF